MGPWIVSGADFRTESGTQAAPALTHTALGPG